MNSDTPLSNFTTQGQNIIVWILVGLVFLWLISFIAELVMVKLKPVLMFIVVAAFVGILVVNVVNKI